ncbi:hypothetical protein [Mesorhizobium sp.]|uniref:hypothetical protein n=1 Tax=Mesorhizobium sp. TaxID=1871066 RepID=UPI000FE39380|nr:hypothetical protein [Mesorhizobium sp.]RWG82671.1 MAG: hypothetical protein EOQ70_22640 [Mesorhizobium sp.]RWG82808.1 MAG: hypothetical protein EOQ69_14780 [Mesorhizobium sp.]RWK15940.1 MAG: hypothetical protein EOR41_21690 [Mesorhizobium sp.]RWK21865.1 MAG: hypothetical protein EOR43_18385 [Mesorhizobium sp.]RWK29900.1 MAG: hypothetical protein EOR44_18515 [Mesorhizobium sp.]
MYRFLLGAAIAATATSAFGADAPVVLDQELAQPHISGYGEVYLGGIYFATPGDDANGTTAGGAARINFPIDARWNIQTDAVIDSLWIEGTNLYSYGGAIHGYWRDPSSYALGGFATITGYGGDEGLGDAGLYTFTVGPEAQAYFGNLTVYGQVYYGQLRASGESEHFDNWGGRGVVRYFAQDDLRFDGELGFSRLSGFGGHFDTFTAALQATYRFSGTPWSVFGRYQLDHLTFSEASGSVNVHKYVVGLRASFGSDTLLSEDRNGATMDTFRPNLTIPVL